jgi:mRNA interferase HigB
VSEARSQISNIALDAFANIEHNALASKLESAMWVVSLKRLSEFWAENLRAEVSLRGWFTLTAEADWRNFSDLRATFPSADLVGNCTVFNIGGNNFRLISRALYRNHKVYVLKVMTHAEYDRDEWPAQCGCHSGPPDRVRAVRGRGRKKRFATKRRRSS